MKKDRHTHNKDEKSRSEHSPEDGFDIQPDPEHESGQGNDAAALISRLRAELKQCRKERQEYLSGWQRSRADALNRRRQAEQAGASAEARGAEECLRKLLPVLDSFDMAFHNKDAWNAVGKEWRDGVTRIYEQLLQVLKEYNVEPIDTAGVPFDPSVHESIKTEAVDSPERDNTVVSVLQRGYRRNGTLIRPAKVSVGQYHSSS